MRAEPGRLVAKGGAEGVQAVALVGGDPVGGLALKIEDGDATGRARDVATCAALRQLGAVSVASLQRLEPFAVPLIRDPRGAVSGEVRPAFTLA